MFLICKSIFCPHKSFISSNSHSLFDLYTFLSKNKIKCHILFCGYVVSDLNNTINELVSMFNDLDVTIFIDIHNVNHGKCYFLNKLHLYLSYNFILYFDHDLFIDNILNPLIFNNKLLVDDEYGLIALNQKGDSRHVFIDVLFKICYNVSIAETTNNMSIASGAFFISGKNINKLSKLENNYVYGFDERYLYDIFKDKHNIILVDYFVYHPIEKNNTFIDFKKHLTECILNNNIDYISSFNKINMFFKNYDNIHD